MALAETSFIDKCEVVSFGSTYVTGNQKCSTIQIRRADIIEKDGIEVAKTFHRHVIVPGSVAVGSTSFTSTNISGEDPLVVSIANAVWTSQSKEAYREWLVGIRSETNRPS